MHLWQLGFEFMTYLEKLRDPRWQRLSAIVKERAEWKCQRCGATDKNLQAHHRLYEAGKEPWEYEPFQLECLCSDCHKLVTQLMRKLKWAACDMTNKSMLKLVRYALSAKHERLEILKVRWQEICKEDGLPIADN